MKDLIRALGLYFVFVSLISCNTQIELSVSFSNSELSYSGRVDKSFEDHAEFYWSGNAVSINFEGSTVSALLQDEFGKNYYYVLLDGDTLNVINVSTEKKSYELVTGLSKGKHTIELYRRTDLGEGKTSFYGFSVEGKNAKVLPKSVEKKRSIEFYGDSISTGYAVDDQSGNDSGESQFANNYLAYSSITARYFDADFRCICKAGIGIMISWFPYIMPDVYDNMNPLDSTSQWDFSSHHPDIVVVNLFQNDSWLVNRPEREEFKKNFGDTPPTDSFIVKAYQSFLSDIRQKYPDAHIIGALGSMDATIEGSIWPGYIQSAIDNLNDDKMYSHFMSYKNSKGHPNREEQQIMANSLINFIEKNIEW
ncbi:MAG: hypothetical protein JXR07_01470 [Reichenbachiella sp.]